MRLLARLLVRWRWIAVSMWAILGAIGLIEAPKTQHVLNTRGGSKHSTEASQVDDLLRQRFAQPLSEFLAVAIVSTIPLDQSPVNFQVDSLQRALIAQPYVRGVLSFHSTHDSMFVSRDGKTTFLIIALRVPRGDSSGGLVVPIRHVVLATLTDLHAAGLTTKVTGRSALDLDVRTISAEDGIHGELLSMPLALIVLVFAFGALVAATLPLIIGFLAITISLAIIGILAQFTPMSVFVLNLTTMIGLGVGIDYSLLIVTRFREELNRGLSRQDAAIRTVVTAGGAVITSGLTVMVGFGALLFTPLTDTRSVGIGGLVVVTVAVALSTTLLPALLAILGRTIDGPRWVARRLAWYHAPMIWEKWARSLSRHPVRALTLGGIGVGILTLPMLFIRIGLPARNWWTPGTESGDGIEILNAMGVSGVITPIRVLVEVPAGERVVAAANLRKLRALSDSFKADPRVRDVRSVVDVRENRSILGYSVLYSDMQAARAQYPEFLDAYLSRDSRIALMDILLSDTTSLTSAMDVVRRARIQGARILPPGNGGRVMAGGFVADNVDLQRDLLRRFPIIVLMILLTTGVMLAIAFRSVLVPIKAIIMNTLSVLATFGLIVLVFQHGWGSALLGIRGPTEAIYVVIPVLVFAVVFGLSMDYEVFLLTRIKEAFDKTGRNDQATMEGLSATASVITSAALIMILVFGVFAFARVLAMQFLGFGLAVAVLLDATLIRMILVPAFMHLAGEWNWWPGVRPRRKAKS
ncbi:MAG: MMPL family transporter [Gemmatimonadota bacterium]